MSDAASPKKKQTKKAPSKPAEHPKYIEMITTSIIALGDRKGSSRQAILKYVVEHFKVSDDSAKQHVKLALKKGVTSGVLTQTKGAGASGSFKVTAKSKEVKKKAPAKQTPKKQAKKKSVAKKATPAKKSTAKKAKPAARPAKKAAKKPTAKKPVAKKAAPKKKPAKKAAKKTKK